MKHLAYLFVGLVLLGCQTSTEEAITTKFLWNTEQAGIWKSAIGQPGEINLLNIAGIQPKTEALEKLGQAKFPINENDIKAEVRDGKTYLQFPLEKEEQIYGLGLNFKNIHQRGKIYRLHVDHYGGQDNGRTHAPDPFYISSKGYGIKDGASELYDDDGTSFDYQEGKYSIMTLRMVDGNGGVENFDEDGPWSYGEISWKFMTK